MIRIVEQAIDAHSLSKEVEDYSCGAVCVFEGRVRLENEAKRVNRLEYECYQPMALKVMEDLRRQALEKWPIKKAVVVHRIGHIPIGEIAVWIGVASAHRQAAFEACHFLIDAVKQSVPIWKKESYQNGQSEWLGQR